MKTTSIAISLLALTLTFGCKGPSATNTSSSVSDTAVTIAASETILTPEQLGELGAKIKKTPNDAQKILGDQGLTEQSFEQQVRKVAQDPEASKRYAAAYKKAS